MAYTYQHKFEVTEEYGTDYVEDVVQSFMKDLRKRAVTTKGRSFLDQLELAWDVITDPPVEEKLVEDRSDDPWVDPRSPDPQTVFKVGDIVKVSSRIPQFDGRVGRVNYNDERTDRPIQVHFEETGGFAWYDTKELTLLHSV